MTDWFRSWHGAPTDPKWLGIAKRAGVAPGIAVAVAWALMDRASQAEDRGSIVGYDADGLGYFYGCEPEQVGAIVQAMTDKGMLVDGRFAAWEKRQPKREREQDDSTDRVRAHRAMKRHVTPCNASETTETPRVDTDTDISSLRSDIARDAGNGSRQKKGTRLPPDWQPSEEDTDYAVSHGVPRDKIPTLAEEYRNYWCARPGKDGLKLDWSATWRNRVLQVCERNGWKPFGQPTSQAPPPTKTWVECDDPRWSSLAQRHREEFGKPLHIVQNRSKAMPGNYVPNDWLAH